MELDLGPVLERCWRQKKPIRTGSAEFFSDFSRFKRFWEGRGELRRILMIGIDRGHVTRSGTSLGTVLEAKAANRDGFYLIFE